MGRSLWIRSSRAKISQYQMMNPQPIQLLTVQSPFFLYGRLNANPQTHSIATHRRYYKKGQLKEDTLLQIPPAFTDALNMLMPFHLKNNRCRVFPILTCIGTPAKPTEMRILQEKAISEVQGSKAIAFKQMTVLEGQMVWEQKVAQVHLVNETTLALRKVIVNTNNKMNPLKKWGDAPWLYKWIKIDDNNSHCVCLAFIGVQKDAIVMQKPDKYFGRCYQRSSREFLLKGENQGSS